MSPACGSVMGAAAHAVIFKGNKRVLLAGKVCAEPCLMNGLERSPLGPLVLVTGASWAPTGRAGPHTGPRGQRSGHVWLLLLIY